MNTREQIKNIQDNQEYIRHIAQALLLAREIKAIKST